MHYKATSPSRTVCPSSSDFFFFSPPPRKGRIESSIWSELKRNNMHSKNVQRESQICTEGAGKMTQDLKFNTDSVLYCWVVRSVCLCNGLLMNKLRTGKWWNSFSEFCYFTPPILTVLHITGWKAVENIFWPVFFTRWKCRFPCVVPWLAAGFPYRVGTGTSVRAPSMTACCSLTKAMKGLSRKSTSPTSTLEASASRGNFFMNLFFSCSSERGRKRKLSCIGHILLISAPLCRNCPGSWALQYAPLVWIQPRRTVINREWENTAAAATGL